MSLFLCLSLFRSQCWRWRWCWCWCWCWCECEQHFGFASQLLCCSRQPHTLPPNNPPDTPAKPYTITFNYTSTFESPSHSPSHPPSFIPVELNSFGSRPSCRVWYGTTSSRQSILIEFMNTLWDRSSPCHGSFSSQRCVVAHFDADRARERDCSNRRTAVYIIGFIWHIFSLPLPLPPSSLPLASL